MQVGWRAVADLRGHELQSRGTLTTANTRIFWPWRPHFKNWEAMQNVGCFLFQPFIQPDDVKRRFAPQCTATVFNCAAQADIVCASALCRVMW